MKNIPGLDLHTRIEQRVKAPSSTNMYTDKYITSIHEHHATHATPTLFLTINSGSFYTLLWQMYSL